MTPGERARFEMMESLRPDIVRALADAFSMVGTCAVIPEVIMDHETFMLLDQAKSGGFAGGGYEPRRNLVRDLELTADGRLLVRRWRYFDRLAGRNE